MLIGAIGLGILAAVLLAGIAIIKLLFLPVRLAICAVKLVLGIALGLASVAIVSVLGLAGLLVLAAALVPLAVLALPFVVAWKLASGKAARA